MSSEPPKITPSVAKVFAEVKSIEAKEKTKRLLIVCATVVVGLWIVFHYAAKVLTSFGEESPVKTVVGIVVAVLVGISGPSYMVYRFRVKLKLFIKQKCGRITELESSIDSTRTSSEIKPDGTSEHD